MISLFRSYGAWLILRRGTINIPRLTALQTMTDDLSKHHRPITTLFNTDHAEQYHLTNDQIEFFHTNGYLAGIRLLNDEQIEALRLELAALSDPNNPGNAL